MKPFLLLFLFCGSALIATAQNKTVKPSVPDSSKKILLAEASCGQCRFNLPGKSCDLAVRIDGQAYFVDGSHIDSHGDAHAEDGFCNAIRKARVQGTVVNNRFQATYFQLLADSTPIKKTL